MKKLLRPNRRLAAMVLSVALLLLAFGIFGDKDFVRSLKEFPFWAVLLILILFALNLLLVSFRLSRILDHLGIPLPPGAALRASIAGQTGSLFVISLFGQVVGRQMVLQRFGLASSVVASVTGYERACLAFTGGMTCLLGAMHLLGRATVFDFVNRISLVEVIIAAGGGLALSLWLGRSRFEVNLGAEGWSARTAINVLEVIAITLAGQFLVISAFVVGVIAVQPNTDLLSLFAATAVISFAASVPITVNGWGIREMAAVAMLGYIGVAGSRALAVSILSGLCVTAITLSAAALVLSKVSPVHENISNKGFAVITLHASKIEKTASWMLAMLTATFVFFQTHVDFRGATINLNFADPLAILALAAVVTHAVMTRQSPNWRVRHLNIALIAISVLLTAGFLHGVQVIGVTQWALMARLLGWLILMGYLCAGYLMVANAGAHGRRRLFETMIATGAFVVMLQIVLRFIDPMNLLTGLPHTANFEGYAANRNAFAFQMLVCLTLLLAYVPVYARRVTFSHCRQSTIDVRKSAIGNFFCSLTNRLWLGRNMFLQSIVMAGILFSASRAGVFAGALLVLVAVWYSTPSERPIIAKSLALAILIWQSTAIISWGMSFFASPLSSVRIQSDVSSEFSNVERWQSLVGGLQMWLQHSVFGAGLGVFIEKNATTDGRPLVIHSTPVWILAEFGLLGAAIFGGFFYILVRHALKSSVRSTTGRIIGMLLLIFGLFSLVHEIFYQRIFWLVLGSSLAIRERRSS
jgi:uncharacterized membrane protein YbhN (UPF0104 family)